MLICRKEGVSWRRESCRQEVLSTCLQEQISPSRWVLREGGKFNCRQKWVCAEGENAPVPENSVHELFQSTAREQGRCTPQEPAPPHHHAHSEASPHPLWQ